VVGSCMIHFNMLQCGFVVCLLLFAVVQCLLLGTFSWVLSKHYLYFGKRACRFMNAHAQCFDVRYAA
jgi:hypothetical protein